MKFTEEPNCVVTGGRWYSSDVVMAVIVTTDRRGGIDWLHVSVSGREGIPSRADMAAVKAHFIGDDRDAVEYWPPAEGYVNHHPNVLHLWARADGQRILPDMRVHDDVVGGLSI